MKSFEHGYFLETAISHPFLMAIRALGEFKGRQMLYAEQSPDVLETLRRVAMIQSAESSNRIEGVTVAPGRIDDLVLKKSRPMDRSEQEVAGYRDALASIHANYSKMRLSPDLILNWHKTLYRYTKKKAGNGRQGITQSWRSGLTASSSLDSSRFQLLPHPGSWNALSSHSTTQ